MTSLPGQDPISGATIIGVSTPTKAREIYALTGTRAIAAIRVAIFHAALYDEREGRAAVVRI